MRCPTALPAVTIHGGGSIANHADPIAISDQFFTDNPGINKLLVVDDNDEPASTQMSPRRIPMNPKFQSNLNLFSLIFGIRIDGARIE